MSCFGKAAGNSRRKRRRWRWFPRSDQIAEVAGSMQRRRCRCSAIKCGHGESTVDRRVRIFLTQSSLRSGCWLSGRGRLAGGLDRFLALGIGGDPDLYVGRQVFWQLDLDAVGIDLIQPAGELKVIWIDIEALRLQSFGDVGSRYRAIEMALLVGAALQRDFNALQLLDQRFLLRTLLPLLPFDLLSARFDLLDISRRRFDSQALRKKIVAGKAGADLDHVADSADVLDAFL